MLGLVASINEQRFLILTALAGGPRHGYGLVEEIAEISNGAIRPRAGALYHALDKLTLDGLVKIDHEQVVDGRLRRYYRLTADGADRLQTEAQKRQQTAKEALRRLQKFA